jgi:DNA repair exonuclease SbcCD nuclease subunit
MRELPPTERGRGSDDVVLVHSSDLHIDSPAYFEHPDRDTLAVLKAVVHAANEVSADVLLLAGDVFEHNRLPSAILEKAAHCLASAKLSVVILPGNHDPLTPESVYERGRLDDLPNVHVIGLSGSNSIILESMDLEIWGNAHRHYGDMQPLRDPLPRKTRWQVAVAHGHHVPEPPYAAQYRPSWLISEQDVNRTMADYVALGHWDRHMCVSTDSVAAYYSGSPRLTGAVNVVSFTKQGTVRVSRQRIPSEFDLGHY